MSAWGDFDDSKLFISALSRQSQLLTIFFPHMILTFSLRDFANNSDLVDF